MRRRLLAAALAGVLAILTAAVPTGAAAVTLSPVSIMVLGDSRSAGTHDDSYRAELDRLLRTGGVEPTWIAAAVSDTRCTYWTSRIHDLLVLHDPDVVILACGTNDDTATVAARDAMGAAIRTITETIRLHRGEVTPTRQLGAYVQLSDPYGVAPAQAWVPPSEERANIVLASNYGLYLPHWASLAVADLSRIPGNHVTLPDGMHPSAYGHGLVARLLYDAGAARGWWPATSEPAPCGLYGRAVGAPVPAGYIACPLPVPPPVVASASPKPLPSRTVYHRP